MSRWPTALGAFSALVVLFLVGCASDGGIDHQKAAAANASLGSEYLRRGENERARNAFDRALHYDQGNFTANWGMAVASERLGEPGAARRYFQQTLAIREAPTVYNSYGAFLCKQGDTKQGVTCFKHALKGTHDASQRAAIQANAGLCMYHAGQVAQASDYFRAALQSDARQATALTSLARIAYNEQHYLSARAFIERADQASGLGADQLLLAVRIERARHDRAAAETYLKRYNDKRPRTPRTLDQLESSYP